MAARPDCKRRGPAMPMGGSPRLLFSAIRPGYCPDDMIGPDILHRDFTLTDRLIDDEKIDCGWEKSGRFVGALTRTHFDAQSQRLAVLNASAQSGAYVVPRERQREEIASDYYFGGMIVERSGKLHPAL